MSGTEFHPVQIENFGRNPSLPSAVTLRAYEVYCHLFGAQPAMVDLAGRGCRGGFGVGELAGYLYARSFPKTEWEMRFKEAMQHDPSKDRP